MMDSNKKTANKQVICEVLMNASKTDKDIVALCSDSRGSGSFTPFADTYPEQFVETGIAEQRRLLYLRPAFCQQEAMNSVKLTSHIQIQTLNL